VVPEPINKDEPIARAERWFAEKGIEWQTLIMTQLGARAQAVASLAIFVPSFLVGGGTITAMSKLQGVNLNDILGPVLLGGFALVCAMLAFGYAIGILYPTDRFGYLTPPPLSETSYDEIDEQFPEISVDRTLAVQLRDNREENDPVVNRMKRKLRIAIWALGTSVVASIIFVLCIATILIT
jgi:hypothetical protein